jgi:hypothetical protein
MQGQGFFQRDRLPAFSDPQFAALVREIGHRAEYALPRPARKPYSSVPYSN